MAKILLDEHEYRDLRGGGGGGNFLQGAGTMLVVIGLGIGVLIHTNFGAGMFLVGGLFLGLSNISGPKVKL